MHIRSRSNSASHPYRASANRSQPENSSPSQMGVSPFDVRMRDPVFMSRGHFILLRHAMSFLKFKKT